MVPLRSLRSSRRAVAVYVDRKGFLIHQTKALWASVLQSGAADTDLVCFGPAEALDPLPDHANLIKVAQPQHRLGASYGFINSIACFEGPLADVLDDYAWVLKSDVDTFLTPAWNGWRPEGFRFGIGRYVHDEATRQGIRDLAAAFDCVHRGVHNIGSTYYGTPADVRAASSRLSVKTIVLASLIASRPFLPIAKHLTSCDR